MAKEIKTNEPADKQEMLQRLKDAPTLYVLISLCTKEPYVVCDQETFDDEVLMFFRMEDAEAEMKRLIEQKVPVSIVKLEGKQMLFFYTSLYTMGVNALLIKEGESQSRVQLADFVRRGNPEQNQDGKKWIENPSLHLTALYYMQESRRQPVQGENPQLKELQEEIAVNFGKGSYIVAVQKEGNGIPVVKLNNEDVYQALFTDVLEFQKFNREDKLRPVVVEAAKVPQVLVAEAKGVVLNPMGVNMPLTLRRNA